MRFPFHASPLVLLLFVFLFVFNLNSVAQTTFTVVCDKTDKTVKVVESNMRSPNYVPIKGGFPFRQVAQKWIDDNYSTTVCDPGQIVKKIKSQSSENIQTPNKTQNTSPVSGNSNATSLPARRTGTTAAIDYKNTSLFAYAKFSNLGKAFNLNKNLLPGYALGIEMLLGKQVYFGTGVSMDLYISDMDGNRNLDKKELIYFYRVPAFLGYRQIKNDFSVAYEAGVAANSTLTGTPLILDSFGQTASKYSINFLGRMKVGTEKIMLEFGTDIWLTKIFQNNDFDMTSVFVGLRFNF